MRPSVPLLLLTLVAILVCADGLWAVLGHFQLDAAGFVPTGLLAVLLVAVGLFYRTLRPDPRLAAMLLGTAFLLVFSLAASVLNYLLLTCAGSRIDFQLAALDRALGFDWPGLMLWMARHPLLNTMALVVYSSMLPQVALLTILLAAKRPEEVYRFLLSVALAALICIAIWTFAPSFGAFSVYPPPGHMLLALDHSYADALLRLLQHGPGLISPRDTKGLIGFPSYHAILALLVAWYARSVPWLPWPAALLNGAVLLATPIQGGHHLVDVLAAFPVTAVVLFIAQRAGQAAVLVNKAPKFIIAPVPRGLFRIALKQKHAREAAAIKPKLSGFP